MSVIAREPRARSNGKIISLPVEWIFPNPAQPRRLFGQEELDELLKQEQEAEEGEETEA